LKSLIIPPSVLSVFSLLLVLNFSFSVPVHNLKFFIQKSIFGFFSFSRFHSCNSQTNFKRSLCLLDVIFYQTNFLSYSKLDMSEFNGRGRYFAWACLGFKLLVLGNGVGKAGGGLGGRNGSGRDEGGRGRGGDGGRVGGRVGGRDGGIIL
jgi:uncharacterized membrane protein YgcG